VSHTFGLGAALLALWFLLSGLFHGLLVFLGLVSCALIVWIASRMDAVDGEGQVLRLYWGRWVRYIGWLSREIYRANLDVARRIVHPDLPISPRVIEVPCSQRTDVGRVTFANSITLTPGTVSMRVGEDRITVHALTREAADELLAGEMDRQVSALERGA
jgi:multicomponent Na+:H+ antiporter subunit E